MGSGTCPESRQTKKGKPPNLRVTRTEWRDKLSCHRDFVTTSNWILSEKRSRICHRNGHETTF